MRTGIGRATALAFAKQGCTQIALLDLNQKGLQETANLLHDLIQPTGKAHKIECVPIDVTSTESVTAAYELVKSKFGRIDYAVQCAGIFVAGDSAAADSLEIFDKHIAVNYRGMWLCGRETLRIMASQTLDIEAFPEAGISPGRAQRGAVVNIASALANYAQPGCAAYTGSKGAVCALTRADAMDYVGLKIRINAVLPGVVDSPMTNPSPEVRAWLEEVPVQKSPIRRFGQVEEIADVAVFLAGNRASLVVGANWAVDGGLQAGFS